MPYATKKKYEAHLREVRRKYKEDPEFKKKIISYKKKYRDKKNPDKEYYNKNREIILAKKKEWYQKKKERELGKFYSNLKYERAHPGRSIKYYHKNKNIGRLKIAA